jgi:hypothetical protein
MRQRVRRRGRGLSEGWGENPLSPGAEGPSMSAPGRLWPVICRQRLKSPGTPFRPWNPEGESSCSMGLWLRSIWVPCHHWWNMSVFLDEARPHTIPGISTGPRLSLCSQTFKGEDGTTRPGTEWSVHISIGCCPRLTHSGLLQPLQSHPRAGQVLQSWSSATPEACSLVTGEAG